MANDNLTAEFVFSLAQASTRTVLLDWETRDGTALEGVDYVAQSGRLTFAPGEITKTVTIQVLQPLGELRKFFRVAITSATNATVDESETGQVTIMPNSVFRGPRGFRGDRGQRGMTAYEEAVALGAFVGSYQDWLNLLRSTDAQLVGFQRSGASSVRRTTKDKLSDSKSPMDYGAIGDGTVHLVSEWMAAGGWASSLADIQARYPHVTSLNDTIDWAAIQAALADGGSTDVTDRTYVINRRLKATVVGSSLFARNRWGSRIVSTGLADRIIDNSAMFFTFTGMSLSYMGTPTAEQAIYSSGSYSEFRNFTVRNAFTGVYLTQGVAQRITNFDVLDYESAGVHFKSLNDVFMRDFIINAGNKTRGRLGGIRLEDKVEALMCSSGDVLGGVYPLTSTAANFVLDARPAYNHFTDVYFDSAAAAAAIDSMVETDFASCWFSTGRTAELPASGAEIGKVDSVRFKNCVFFNCGLHGANVQAAAKRVEFSSCSFESNSVTAGDGVGNGLNIVSGATGWIVTDGKASNGLYTGKQGWGIAIGANCANFGIKGIDVRGNLTGSIKDDSTTTLKSIIACQGYTTKAKGVANIIVGQTVATITHGLARKPNFEDIMLTFAGSPAARGVTSVYLANLTDTTFQIVSNAAVTTSPLPVAWQADIGG